MQLVIKTQGATAYIPVKNVKDAEAVLETLLKVMQGRELLLEVKVVNDAETIRVGSDNIQK